LPNLASQMRTRSLRVNAETIGRIGACQHDAHQLSLLMRFQAGAAHPSSHRARPGHARCSGSPSPLRPGGPCRAASAASLRLRPESALAIGSSRRARRALVSALASLRKTAGVRSRRRLRYRRPNLVNIPRPRELRKRWLDNCRGLLRLQHKSNPFVVGSRANGRVLWSHIFPACT
jgi:hypothetical protein